jgi:hypothetical protein
MTSASQIREAFMVELQRKGYSLTRLPVGRNVFEVKSDSESTGTPFVLYIKVSRLQQGGWWDLRGTVVDQLDDAPSPWWAVFLANSPNFGFAVLSKKVQQRISDREWVLDDGGDYQVNHIMLRDDFSFGSIDELLRLVKENTEPSNASSRSTPRDSNGARKNAAENVEHPGGAGLEAPVVEYALGGSPAPGLPPLPTPEEWQQRGELLHHIVAEWMADDSGYDEEVWPELKAALDRNREESGQYRKLFNE